MNNQTDNVEPSDEAPPQDAPGAPDDDPLADIGADAESGGDRKEPSGMSIDPAAFDPGRPEPGQPDPGHPDPGMSALSHVPVEVQVVLGGARMPIGNVLKLSRGAVVEIDRKVGEQVDIHINNRPVARGEIIIVDEDRLGVTLTEIINVQAGLR